MAYYVVLGIGILVSLYFCLKRRSGSNLPNLLLKTASSLFFLLTAVVALMLNKEASTYGCLIIFGGILGLVGDVLLDLKGIYKMDAETYLNGGFISFLIGHIFYSAAVIFSSGMKWWIAALCVVISFASGGISIALAKPMKLDYGKFKGIVFLYVSILFCTMTLSIAAMLLSKFSLNNILFAVGAVLFTLSDLVLSGTYFGQGKNRAIDYFINHFLYYSAQFLIASTIMFI